MVYEQTRGAGDLEVEDEDGTWSTEKDLSMLRALTDWQDEHGFDSKTMCFAAFESWLREQRPFYACLAESQDFRQQVFRLESGLVVYETLDSCPKVKACGRPRPQLWGRRYTRPDGGETWVV